MTDAPLNTPGTPARKPIPITREELLADWEANIDRVAAGDTLMLMENGEATHYLMPLSEYEALNLLDQEAELRARRKSSETGRLQALR